MDLKSRSSVVRLGPCRCGCSEQGAQGTAGAQGPEGPPGSQGPQGPPGSQGSSRSPGVAGTERWKRGPLDAAGVPLPSLVVWKDSMGAVVPVVRLLGNANQGDTVGMLEYYDTPTKTVWIYSPFSAMPVLPTVGNVLVGYTMSGCSGTAYAVLPPPPRYAFSLRPPRAHFMSCPTTLRCSRWALTVGYNNGNSCQSSGVGTYGIPLSSLTMATAPSAPPGVPPYHPEALVSVARSNSEVRRSRCARPPVVDVDVNDSRGRPPWSIDDERGSRGEPCVEAVIGERVGVEARVGAEERGERGAQGGKGKKKMKTVSAGVSLGLGLGLGLDLIGVSRALARRGSSKSTFPRALRRVAQRIAGSSETALRNRDLTSLHEVVGAARLRRVTIGAPGEGRGHRERHPGSRGAGEADASRDASLTGLAAARRRTAQPSIASTG